MDHCTTRVLAQACVVSIRWESPHTFRVIKTKKYLCMIHKKVKALLSPAFDKTTWASMDLLIFEEQTVPNDNLEGIRRDFSGGKPGGVEGRWRPGTNDWLSFGVGWWWWRRWRGLAGISLHASLKQSCIVLTDKIWSVVGLLSLYFTIKKPKIHMALNKSCRKGLKSRRNP